LIKNIAALPEKICGLIGESFSNEIMTFFLYHLCYNGKKSFISDFFAKAQLHSFLSGISLLASYHFSFLKG
jgi:hypothetical protein